VHLVPLVAQKPTPGSMIDRGPSRLYQGISREFVAEASQ
jgi:hypothetical protein